MLVFARKYRPKRLSEVIGQPSIVQTLTNALTRDHLHHAYLFGGKFGSGKTSTARILAASENCKTSPGLDPCGSCDVCEGVFAGTHADIVEIDAASDAGKVDQIRELKHSAAYHPIDGATTKYYIIDECHRMSPAAEEALLKILEEPPSKVRFILCTTEMKQMRGTILSRCQYHDFKEIYWRQIAQFLENIIKLENIKGNKEALNLCAKLSDGSMRNGLQNLEKLIDFAGDQPITGELAQKAFGSVSDLVFYDLVDAVTGPPDATKGFKIINDLLISGTNFDQICDGISENLRNILIGISSTACAGLISVSEEGKKRLEEQLKRCKGHMTAVMRTTELLSKSQSAVAFGLSADVALQMWLLESIFAFRK